MNHAPMGLIGLGVMGENLAQNMADHHIPVQVYNRTPEKLSAFLNRVPSHLPISGSPDLAQCVKALPRPRTVFLMVKAGDAVDAVIASLLPLLEPDDIIIDGGNSHFQETQRRVEFLAGKNICFIGCGVSGGEEGARHGPSLMPGGNADGWPVVAERLQAIAAKADDGSPCCQWLGSGGAGHFVKMVHNGIEYGDMQIICEAYDVMRTILEMDNPAMAGVFARWNTGVLQSYLIEITSRILEKKEGDGFLVDRILDVAGQKGTGRWTGVMALEEGVPLSLITEAVYARMLSSHRDLRQQGENLLFGPSARFSGDRSQALDSLGKALYAAKIISYAQGFMLFQTASRRFGWGLDCAAIARIWRQGCIIRASFLDHIARAYEENPRLEHLLFAPFFADALNKNQQSLRESAATGCTHGVPMPAMAAALSFYDGFRSSRLPANLLQAQRDFFGAHTYERVDRERGSFFHTDWTA